MKSLFSRHQSGDTIVEVLIAIAVVSAVLMGAFLVSSKSVIGVRDGQEHGEVLQVLQGQVENVRSLALSQPADTGGIFSAGDFCVDNSNPNAPKRVDVSNAVCKNIQNRYNVSVSYNTTTNVFTFVGTWDALGGGTNQEKLNYRVYAGKPFKIATGSATPTPPSTPSGDAYFGNDGPQKCGGAGQPRCNTINPTGKYRYDFYVYNLSNNDPADILGCTWNWGDGTIQNFGPGAVECQYHHQLLHSYPRPDPGLPYPQDCNKTTYKVTLTMKVSGVTPNPTWTGYALFAFCGGA